MDQDTKKKIEELVKGSDVFLFMKGEPARPMCGFSAGVVSALGELEVDYNSFNVLSDESIRQGIKEFANWPTIPQLYINGEFVGGHDIVMQMASSGDLQKKLSS